MVVSPGQPPPNFNQQFTPGGYGVPPPMQAAPPPKKGGAGKWIAMGCGCVLVIAIAATIAIIMLVKSVGPGEEVTSTDAVLGQQFQATYTQSGSQQYEVWLDLDVAYTSGYQLAGPINISVNNQHVGQYQLAETGSGSPIQGRNTRVTYTWVSTNIGGAGGTSGKLKLFTLPAYESGATVTVWGTITGNPGLNASRLRVLVTD
jgi:hypothetical protein